MISGVTILQLSWEAGRLGVVSEEDHLLRRFGQVDVIKLQPGLLLTCHRRSGADEIWTLFSGEAILNIIDLREESPTYQQKKQLPLNEEIPQAVLIPFGLEAEITSQEGGLLLRISSHADQLFPEDRIFDTGEKDG